MTWQEACQASAVRRAWRRIPDGRVVERRPDGRAIIFNPGFKPPHDAVPQEYEGFTDWEPAIY